MPKNKRHRIHPEIRSRARRLRRNQTPAEQRLWRALRNRQLGGLKFRRQHPVGPYIVDFYCASSKLIIELDGGGHLEQEEYDNARTEWLNQQGYRVIRFTNREVNQQLQSVADEILTNCQLQDDA